MSERLTGVLTTWAGDVGGISPDPDCVIEQSDFTVTRAELVEAGLLGAEPPEGPPPLPALGMRLSFEVVGDGRAVKLAPR